jgi:hypothetical protein
MRVTFGDGLIFEFRYSLFRPKDGCSKAYGFLRVSGAIGVSRITISVAERLRLEALRPSD